jgi:hypothetical protein
MSGIHGLGSSPIEFEPTGDGADALQTAGAEEGAQAAPVRGQQSEAAAALWQARVGATQMFQSSLDSSATIAELQRTAVGSLLAKYDADPGAFDMAMVRIYGPDYDSGAMKALISKLRAGDTSDLPAETRFVDSSVLGSAEGAYAPSRPGAVFLKDTLKNNPAALQDVYNEEWLGHGMQSIVGGGRASTMGDEGEALARYLGGENLDNVLQHTRSDFDRGTITVDGKQVPVRFRDTGMHRRYEAGVKFDVANWPDEGAANDAFAASTLAKLKKAEILGEAVRLDTELPADIKTRLDADPDLNSADIKTYGDLARSIVGDADADGLRDVDCLTLGRYLPGGTQQQILKALTEDLPGDELVRGLKGAGYEAEVSDAGRTELALEAPAGFGLEGQDEIDRMQQQLLLRKGMIFTDANTDGKVDPLDTVEYIDAAGQVQTQQYKDLPEDLKKMVRFNMAVVDACYEYTESSSRIHFPHYNSRTGESGEEKVNKDFWKVGTAEAARGQISWELKDGVKPSDAIADPFTGNGDEYTTECAHARTVMRLHGLGIYYNREFGEGEGTFRFNGLFARDDANKQKVSDYLEKFEAWKAEPANADKGWSDFTAVESEPKIEYDLEVSRHYTLGANESYLEPWADATGESAGGTTGYFHNRSVSPLGVKIGYIGENVLDLGYKDGERLFWGHPGGIKGESRWQSELAAGDIPIDAMSDYQQYFDAVTMKRDARSWYRDFSEKTSKEISQLEREQPVGWEAQVQEKKDTRALFKAMTGMRVAMSDGFKKRKLDDAQQWLTDNEHTQFSGPQDMEGLHDVTLASTKRSLATAFGQLPEDQQKEFADAYGKSSPGRMTRKEKACSALYATLGLGGSTMHPTLFNELRQSVTAVTANEWLEGKFASRDSFQDWLGKRSFKSWYRQKTGERYQGETDLTKMTTDDVQKIVELALPMVKYMNTAYGEMSADITVGRQMAMLLKEGELPKSDYGAETPVGPLE